MRNPRQNPVPSDVLTRFGTTREVTGIKHSSRYIRIPKKGNFRLIISSKFP
jgi:hypothetical protein